MRGDLSTLCWVQRISSVNIDEENLIRIVYASLNFRDVMIASGRLTSTFSASFTDVQNNSPLIGIEFVGFNKSGQRIMGLCANK